MLEIPYRSTEVAVGYGKAESRSDALHVRLKLGQCAIVGLWRFEQARKCWMEVFVFMYIPLGRVNDKYGGSL
jgi:hypothetical protein